jgi:hypothetical protein
LPDERIKMGTEALARTYSLGFDRLAPSNRKILDNVVDYSADECLFAGKVIVQSGMVNTGSHRDLSHAQSLKSFFGEGLVSGADNRAASSSALR